MNLTEQFGTISRGPFKGMNFALGRSDGTLNRGKLLGTYETEIHPYLYDAIGRNPKKIINIGAGDGYYSVGCSLLLPNCKVIAYEAADHERKMHLSTIEMNRVYNCEVREYCSADELLSHDIDDDTLIICDCEGYELEIFSSKLFDKFSNFTALIETHDFINPMITNIIDSNFKNRGFLVYGVESVRDLDKPSFYNLRELENLSYDEKFHILKERPDNMKWLYCKKIT